MLNCIPKKWNCPKYGKSQPTWWNLISYAPTSRNLRLLDLKLPPSWIFQTSKDQRGGFPGGSVSKEPACQCRTLRFGIPGLGRSHGEGTGHPLQYSCLENPMHRGAWRATYSPWGRKESDTTERLNQLKHNCHQGAGEVGEQVTPERPPGTWKHCPEFLPFCPILRTWRIYSSPEIWIRRLPTFYCKGKLSTFPLFSYIQSSSREAGPVFLSHLWVLRAQYKVWSVDRAKWTSAERIRQRGSRRTWQYFHWKCNNWGVSLIA